MKLLLMLTSSMFLLSCVSQMFNLDKGQPMSLNKGDILIVTKAFFITPAGSSATQKEYHDPSYSRVRVGSKLKVTKLRERGSYTNGYFYTVYAKIIGANSLNVEVDMNSVLIDNWGNEYAEPYVRRFQKLQN